MIQVETDFEILKTWLNDNIEICKQELEDAPDAEMFNFHSGKIAALTDTLNVINLAAAIRGRM